ncbi:hypothetical protein GQ42DRAFT_160445 [Ramicandelaber brevisporus]|nr:hypothetical protein GQ42DRAFT_160445 [Ramicandelaber brevisporus]
MTKTAPGKLIGKDGAIFSEFTSDHGLIEAQFTLNVPVEYFLQGVGATLEYDNFDDLKGDFKITTDSVIGPDELHLLLVKDSGVKAKVTAKLESKLPSALKEGGTATFITF